MKTSTRLFTILLLPLPAALAVAAEESAPAPVDTSEWKCKYCAFEEGFSGTVDAGIGSVSTDSYKFGEYTGLQEEGLFLIGNAELRSRGEKGSYWNVNVSNLGLDSRSLGVEGGSQGRYKVNFNYDELPHYISDSAATPYLGTGTPFLTLPGGWVPGATTGDMTSLSSSLHPVNLDTSRKRLGVGVTLVSETKWEYAVKFRHETKEGTQRIAGTFFFNSAQLVMPVDTVTDQIDASASYTGRKLQARLAYYASLFSNNNSALNWENPYTPGVGGPTTGQLALAPDNQFHQFLVSAGYSFTDRTRATADIAYGRMTQNASFLDATVNTNLVVPALPATSLDGQVDTLNANLTLTSALSDRLRLNASYVYNDHADKTPMATYSWVSTDILVSPTPRTNLPYSFTQGTLKLGGDYRFAPRSKVSLGADLDSLERTYQEVTKNRENTVWGKVRTNAWNWVDITMKGAHADREVSGYEVLPWLNPVENPLMRKYNMADRIRDTYGVRFDLYAWQVVNFGFGYDRASDDYSHSQVGLTSSQDTTLSADASAIVAKDTSVHAYYTHETIESEQSGSSSATTPDWTAENNDLVKTAGIGAKHALIKGKLDIGVDYTRTNARGEQRVYDGIAARPFPDTTYALSAVKLNATYRLKDNLSVAGTYWYQHYDSANWQLNGVNPDTISNVLTLGETPPSYYVNVMMLSLRYKF